MSLLSNGCSLRFAIPKLMLNNNEDGHNFKGRTQVQKKYVLVETLTWIRTIIEGQILTKCRMKDDFRGTKNFRVI